jgi:hypothetical protein
MSVIVQQDATIYSLLYFCKLLYMFRVVTPPIIRSTYNCNYSIWHWSNFGECSVWSQLKMRVMDRTVSATFRDCGRTPETCWAVNKRQDNKMGNCCTRLVIYLNCTMMHGLTNIKFMNERIIITLYSGMISVNPIHLTENFRAFLFSCNFDDGVLIHAVAKSFTKDHYFIWQL